MAHFYWLGSFYIALYHSRLPMLTRLVFFQTDDGMSFSFPTDDGLHNLIHFVKVRPTFWKLYHGIRFSIIRWIKVGISTSHEPWATVKAVLWVVNHGLISQWTEVDHAMSFFSEGFLQD